ncbi:MAG TPA: YkgJ family cysteine cluster protein [Aromatoleum sp.]|uniref:YkgJ family cysteine cluster protein n=1 Tax=Aromatoleum sp. TaxID=2307007 RepID=UPI002B47EEB5|nr:YkgJ family cysteine cluster protein [Aromatoleum sp.]HJV28192.1 YkgJ family cysteine cluster protein [Aromatoleum sp.]
MLVGRLHGAVAGTPVSGDNCVRCGACCAAFRVDFHCSELASAMPGGVPDAMTVPVIGRLVRMRGTDTASPRCIALEGEIGVEVRCTIYDGRPSPCRDFAPYAPIGIGEDACDRARARHGMKPL